MEIGIVPNPLEWLQWPKAKKFLDPALSRSDEGWNEVESELASNRLQLWVVLWGPELIAAAITRIVSNSRGKFVVVYLIGGKNFRDWIAALSEKIAVWARNEGASRLRAYGRHGWKNPLAALGWKTDIMTYEMRL